MPKDSDFKVLYGMEAYLVDDLKGMVTNPKKQSLDGRFVVFDIETTGFSPLPVRSLKLVLYWWKMERSQIVFPHLLILRFQFHFELSS